MQRRRYAPACHAGRERLKEGKPGVGVRGPRGRLGPQLALQGGAGAPPGTRRVFTFPLIERQCRHLSAGRVTSGAGGAGAGVGARWGQGCPTPAGPHVPSQPAKPAGPTGALQRRAGAAAKARYCCHCGVAVGAGNARLCLSVARLPLCLHKLRGRSHSGAPSLRKRSVKKPGKSHLTY